MKPILYEANEREFNTNGLGRLADAISCKVTEERNGVYELAMEYPQTGIHYADLAEGRLIYAVPFDGGRNQIFRIYYVSEPLSGIVTVNAEHINYLLSKMVVMPFSAGSAAEVFAKIPQYAVGDCPFAFSTDKEVVANFNLSNPKEIRRILGGEAGSILDVYGKGEYEFDNFTVILRTNRGANSGVTLRYGKNITELQRITDSTDTYVGIVPFWADDTQTITLPEKVVYSADHENDYAYKSVITVDFSSEFETAPTEEQLRERANRYLTANEGWTIKQTIKVSFVALWNTEEYKNVAPLERVHLCDTVNVFVKKLNINATAKVVKTVYDVLLERYDSIELGDASTSLAKTIQDQYIEPAVKQSTSHMDKAISHATKLIQGGLGGHVVMKPNADGEPEEILIMDTDDVSTAVNVLRINMNGIGFSSNGYNGPFWTAWTLDGHFVADFIDTGTLRANLVKAGILSDEKGLNYWNMETGELHLSARTQVGNSTVATQEDVDSVSTKIDVTAKSITQTVSATYTSKETFNTAVNNLQDQIDDNIETFTGSAVPTLNNFPASDWATDATKDSHVGDLYVVNSHGGNYAGFYYRFEKVGSTYQWTLLKDTEITKALADAAAAQTKANAVGDDLAQNYSTTVEMNSAIEQTASSITQTVSATYETKNNVALKISDAKQDAYDHADRQANIAEINAGLQTDTKLENYSTTIQMNSAISQSASDITSRVSKTYETKENAIAKLENANEYAYELHERALDHSDSVADQAEANAANYTDDALNNYSTTVEMRSEIQQSAEGLTVEINKKVGNNEVITKINASAESVSIDTERMDLNTSGWNIMSNGDFSLGNGALTYVHGDKYIALKNGLSLALNGIPLTGDRYRFTETHALMYNEETRQWQEIPTTIQFNGNGQYTFDVVQFPYHTTITGLFVLSANFSTTYLFERMFPPEAIRATGGPYMPILQQSASNLQMSNVGYANLSAGIINYSGYQRYRGRGLYVDRTISSSNQVRYIGSVTYPSYSYPLHELFENGYIDVPT